MVDSSLFWLSIVSAVIVIFTFVIGILAPKSMSYSLLDLSSKLKDINSDDGDLTRRVNSTRKDKIGKGNSATKTSVDLSHKTLEALEKITEASKLVSDVAAQTATATEEQKQVSEDVSKNLTIMSDQTRANHDVSENNVKASESTMHLATDLSNTVTRFKL